MISAFSRRQLANYAVNQLLDGASSAKLARQLAASLIVSKRQNQADLLIEDIFQELENRGQLAKVRLTSASQLSAQLKSQLANFLKRAIGVDEVIFEEIIDKEVIGGTKVETANHSWDKTLARQLTELRRSIV